MPSGNCPQTNPKVYCPHNLGQCNPIGPNDQICIHVKTLDKAQKVGKSLFLVAQETRVQLPEELLRELKEEIEIVRSQGSW
jgi:hypothetical protein